MPKRTYQPKRRRRVRRHGFRSRMAVKKSGKSGPVIKSRRAKGRKQLAVRVSGVRS